jgi:elongation factor G
MIRTRLGARPVPIQIPLGSGDSFAGIIDLVTMKAVTYDEESQGAVWEEKEIPDEWKAQAASDRHFLIEACSEFEDGLIAKFLDGIDPGEEEIRHALRKGTLKAGFVPVLCGAAFKNKGVQRLLDAVIDYLPSPLDVPDIQGIEPKRGKPASRKTRDDEPFAALAFKIMTDPYVGKLTYFRVYSGTASTGVQVLNPREDRKERLGRLLLMHANKREDIDTVYAGDIVAAVGLRYTRTGDTLCDTRNPIVLESMEFPEPVIFVAIEPKTKADQDKLTASLSSLMDEDPTFRVRTDNETGQMIISGMGELHLEIIADRLLRDFKVQANVGKPQVAYKETIQRPAEAEGRFIRQTGGKGQYGHVVVRIEPAARGTGFVFENRITGGVIPREYVPPVEKGLREATSNGILAGYPLVDIKAILLDGSYHPVDSSEVAFKIAASMALHEALKLAEPVMLEPVMAVEVVLPEEYLGDVLGDLNGRRAQIEGMALRKDAHVIHAKVPLKEMFGYATDLRSRTQGRAVYTMQFSHYQAYITEEAKRFLEKVKGIA